MDGKVFADIGVVVGVPTCEGVMLYGRSLGGCCRFAILYGLGFEHRLTIEAKEGNGICIFLIQSGNGEVGLNIVKRLIPAGKGIAFHLLRHGCRSSLTLIYIVVA